MIKFFLAIPADLNNGMWWTYPAALVGIIIVCGIILSLFKRIKPEKEANKLIKKAIKYLNRASKGKMRVSINLLTAKNLLRTARYHYSELINNKEAYKFRGKLEVLDTVFNELEAISEPDEDGNINYKENLTKPIENLKGIVD